MSGAARLGAFALALVAAFALAAALGRALGPFERSIGHAAAEPPPAIEAVRR